MTQTIKQILRDYIKQQSAPVIELTDLCAYAKKIKQQNQ